MNKKIKSLLEESGVQFSTEQRQQIATLAEKIRISRGAKKAQEDELLNMITSFQDANSDVVKVLSDVNSSLKRTKKVEITNFPKVQKVKGEVEISNIDEIKVEDIEIDEQDVTLNNRKAPKDFIAIRFTDGKKWVDPRRLFQRIIAETPRRSSGSSTNGDQIYGEVPLGTIDSANKVFTLATTPIVGTVRVYCNGLRGVEGVGYTIAAGTITFTNAPIGGSDPDVIIVDYEKTP